jgi:hypothetical protein
MCVGSPQSLLVEAEDEEEIHNCCATSKIFRGGGSPVPLPRGFGDVTSDSIAYSKLFLPVFSEHTF